MNPYRHRLEFNAQDFIDEPIVEFCKAEVKVGESLLAFER